MTTTRTKLEILCDNLKRPVPEKYVPTGPYVAPKWLDHISEQVRLNNINTSPDSRFGYYKG
jgi:hypothetical protein